MSCKRRARLLKKASQAKFADPTMQKEHRDHECAERQRIFDSGAVLFPTQTNYGVYVYKYIVLKPAIGSSPSGEAYSKRNLLGP